MIARPSPARIRAVVHAAGRTRRPRSASVITPSSARSYSTRFSSHTSRGFRTVSAAAHLTSNTALRALQRVLHQAVRSLRTLARPQRSHSHVLFNALRSIRLTYNVRSPLLKGAISAFRSTAQKTSAQTTRNAYSQISKGTVGFARGTLSGIGSRPVASLGLSPLRGGVGLQTSRKFSSGARVFDHLVVNAPLALRLVADEVEDKARLAQRKTLSRRGAAAGPRRTGAIFGSAQLPGNAFAFATNQAQRRLEKQRAVSICESTRDSVTTSQSEDFEQYFVFPQLPLSSSDTSRSTVVTIRLIDPLHTALGGREPSPPTHDPRLFDQAFLLDAQLALEYEHRRYLQAKALLRVLWHQGWVHEEMDLSDTLWTINITGPTPAEVRDTLQTNLAFDFHPWCSIHSPITPTNPEDPECILSTISLAPSSWDTLPLPPRTDSPSCSLPSLTVSQPSLTGSLLISLPSSADQDEDEGSELYDSRSF